MFRNNVPLKVAFGYGFVAIILIVAIILVYSNTQSLTTINKSLREYANRQEQSDSAINQLLSDEKENMRQLNEVLDRAQEPGVLYTKIKNLQRGKDSVIVKPKITEEHHIKSTTVEVARTRKGFFRRFADLFRGAHADTVNIKRDSSLASVDTVSKPVNISHKVAKILSKADNEDRNLSKKQQKDVGKELNDLKQLTTVIAQQQTYRMVSLHHKEQKAIQQNMEQAMKARHRLILQIVLLACLAIATAIVLFWRIYRDSKREKQYREELENANEEIKRVMEQREQLLLTITHDIKAPAASITGFTDLLKNYIPSAKGLSLLKNVHDSAVHLSQLVASLLDYNQLEDGEIKVNNTDFMPDELASQCIMGMKPRAYAKGLTITAKTTNCEGIICHGDAFRIRQIIDNLLSNAIKYTDNGYVSLSVGIKDNTLLISVSDTGKGISEKDLTTIFQAFKRLKNAQGIEGTGLGLSIVKQLLTLLNGKISVTSAVGKGTTFSVSIPIEVSQKQVISTEVGKSCCVKTTDHKVKGYNNHNLLILDDDPLQLKLLQEMIRQVAGDNWTVTACNHITDALTSIHNIHPSLMFMDIEMPEMNGMDFIRHIDHHDMKVVAMTAHDMSITSSLKAVGFDDCLFKPIKTEDLSAILGISMSKQDLNSAIGNITDDEEIMNAIKTELKDFKDQLSTIIQTTPIDKNAISSIAHKLQPLAKMLNLDSTNYLEHLTPENINKEKDTYIIEYVNRVIKEL